MKRPAYMNMLPPFWPNRPPRQKGNGLVVEYPYVNISTAHLCQHASAVFFALGLLSVVIDSLTTEIFCIYCREIETAIFSFRS